MAAGTAHPIDYSCMGYSVPAAIGAKLACPDAPVIALAGDGAFLMTGLELLTAAHHGIAIAVFVLRDRELAQIAQFQKVAMNRKVQSALPDYDLETLCRSLGVSCLRLEQDAETTDVLERVAAVTQRGPAGRGGRGHRLLAEDVLHGTASSEPTSGACPGATGCASWSARSRRRGCSRALYGTHPRRRPRQKDGRDSCVAPVPVSVSSMPCHVARHRG